MPADWIASSIEGWFRLVFSLISAGRRWRLAKKELVAKARASFLNVEAKVSFCQPRTSSREFVREIHRQDSVVTYDPGRRRYVLGTVQGDVQFSEDDPQQPYQRAVDWTHYVPRDVVSASARNSLGAIQTLFRVQDDVARELEAKRTAIGAEQPVPAGAPAGRGRR